MARYKKKEGKNNAPYAGKVPQEVEKDDNSRSLKSVAHEDIQHRWHQSVHDLPPGQIIDIPYLKQLAIRAIVPIAYCKHSDIDIVTNFVPAYLLRFTKNIWQLLDEEDILLSQHNWEDGDDSILNLFGTYMQHPEEEFVRYFGGTPVAAFEQGTPPFKEGSPRRSPRKNLEPRSPASSSMKTPNVIGEQPETSSQLNCTSKPDGEEHVNSLRVSTRHSAAATATGAVASRPARTETTAIATKAVGTKTASNDNDNPRPNVQSHPRKTNYQQLPLNKHRPSTVYYHSAFTTYPRHNRPENVASTPDVLDTLLKTFFLEQELIVKKFGILPLPHGAHPRTSYQFFPCHR